MLFTHYYPNVVSLSLSAEAEAGSGGDQPVRNKLIEWNGEGGYIPRFHLSHFNRICLKKRIRKKKKNMCQNTKNKQLLTWKKVNIFQDMTS
jgi:hypothetical protein